MAILPINLGAYANDGTGDDLRTAFQKVNANFQELSGANNIANGTNLGAGVGIFAQRNIANLEFKTLTSTNNTVLITSTANTVNLAATTDVVADTSPQLGGNLDLNGHVITGIYGGGIVNTPIDGYSVSILAGILELLLSSNPFDINLGSFDNPTGGNEDPNSGIDLDMGGFILNSYSNTLDFGVFYP